MTWTILFNCFLAYFKPITMHARKCMLMIWAFLMIYFISVFRYCNMQYSKFLIFAKVKSHVGRVTDEDTDTSRRHNKAPAFSRRQAAEGNVEPRKPLSSIQSLKVTRLSAPLWASHILACTCLWRSRVLVRPPPHQPSLLRIWGEAWGSLFMADDRQGSRLKKRQLWWERKRGVCTHVPFVLLSTSPLVLHGHVLHNRVLTGAVSRQRPCDHCGYRG